jgi:hypothetical protein
MQSLFHLRLSFLGYPSQYIPGAVDYTALPRGIRPYIIDSPKQPRVTITTNPVCYQNCLFPQINAIQEEIDDALPGEVSLTPVVEGLLEFTVGPRDTGTGEPALTP